MKKDAVYSMRMSSRVREALKKAAQKERRTVASLLDKIIIEYLSQEGHINLDAERRNHRRTRITLPARSIVSEGSQKKSFPGVVLDLSMGGVLLTYAKGSDIPFSSVGKLPRFELCLEDPRSHDQLNMKCDTCHMRDTGNEIQVGARFIDPGEQDLEKLAAYFE
jgi:PilZ domain/Arc-like DNA binding domain